MFLLHARSPSIVFTFVETFTDNVICNCTHVLAKSRDPTVDVEVEMWGRFTTAHRRHGRCLSAPVFKSLTTGTAVSITTSSAWRWARAESNRGGGFRKDWVWRLVRDDVPHEGGYRCHQVHHVTREAARDEPARGGRRLCGARCTCM